MKEIEETKINDKHILKLSGDFVGEGVEGNKIDGYSCGPKFW